MTTDQAMQTTKEPRVTTDDRPASTAAPARVTVWSGPAGHAPGSDATGGTHPLVVRDLSAYFGSHHAVEGVDLSFPPNTVTALIGPSGCGKSTFIRCLNRMHELIPGARATGDVLLHGQDIYGP